MNSLEYYNRMLRLRIEAGELSSNQILEFIQPIFDYAQSLLEAHPLTAAEIDMRLNETEQCTDLRSWEAHGGPERVLIDRG